jgi:hypothetical protein
MSHVKLPRSTTPLMQVRSTSGSGAVLRLTKPQAVMTSVSGGKLPGSRPLPSSHSGTLPPPALASTAQKGGGGGAAGLLGTQGAMGVAASPASAAGQLTGGELL